MSDWTRLSLAVMDYIEEDVWDMREKYFYTLDENTSWMYNIREERAGKAGFTPAYSSTDGFLLPAINIYQFITLSFNVTGTDLMYGCRIRIWIFLRRSCQFRICLSTE